MSRQVKTPTETVALIQNFQGYSHSVEECSEIIRDYEMKDMQVLSKVTNLYMGKQAFLRSGHLKRIKLGNILHFPGLS